LTPLGRQSCRPFGKMSSRAEDDPQMMDDAILLPTVQYFLCPHNQLYVRSHSHDISFMHSDVLPFYTYTVVAELYLVVVTVSLVSLFIPSGGGLEP
jgi:hypothetical protein